MEKVESESLADEVRSRVNTRVNKTRNNIRQHDVDISSTTREAQNSNSMAAFKEMQNTNSMAALKETNNLVASQRPNLSDSQANIFSINSGNPVRQDIRSSRAQRHKPFHINIMLKNYGEICYICNKKIQVKS
jgi:hypothetical protein